MNWYRINPKRHGAQLAWFAKTWSQFAGPIGAAGRLIRAEKSGAPRAFAEALEVMP